MTTRRDLLQWLALASATSCARPRPAESVAPRAGGAPEPRWGVQSGDVTANEAVVWSRADRPSSLVVEWDVTPAFSHPRRAAPVAVNEDGDLVGKVRLTGLPAGSIVHYRARFEAERASDWVVGSLRTAPSARAPVVFAWSGDTVGQGWGIDPSRGGLRAYATLLERAPHFFLHCGDAIYADGPLTPVIDTPDGPWKNLVVPAKTHVAESLDDYRGAFLYPRHCRHVRAMHAAVPVYHVWDDHEVRDNWFPGQVLADARYTERDVSTLALRARRAMFEHTPTLRAPSSPMYRRLSWGPLLDVLLLDGRSHRTPNWPRPEREKFFGDEQMAWLADELSRSKALWKVIATDMPLGLRILEKEADGTLGSDGVADQRDGAPGGREEEIARLLTHLHARGVKNVVWLCADVHYAAALRYDPARAAHKTMSPFWEFVAGPMHALAFPRGPLDATFGPEIAFATEEPRDGGTPAEGRQYFGVGQIDATGALTVTLVDARGRDLHVQRLAPDLG